MWHWSFCVYLIVFILKDHRCDGLFRIFPEDVATGFAAIYGFSPRLVKGNDHRVGFGFRFGNHADLQVLYELGPQVTTNQLQPIRVRSASVRQRTARRRPVLALLLGAGLLKNGQYELDYNDNECDEPR